MKRHLLTLIVTLCALLPSGAQSKITDSVFAETPDGQPVSAQRYDFRKPCYNFTLSPDGQQALVFFRSKDKVGNLLADGEMALCNLSTGDLSWSQLFDYRQRLLPVRSDNPSLDFSPERTTRLTAHGVLIVNADRCEMLTSDGQGKKWKAKIFPVYFNDSLDIMLGYRSAISPKLRALRMSTGETLWEAKVPHKGNWGWDETLRVNDSVLVVLADELNFINLLNGTIHQYPLKTGYSTAGKSILAGLAAGLAFGLIGVAVISTGSSNGSPMISSEMVAHTCSNVLRQGDRYYVSDRKRLACVDANGEELWSTELPSKALGYAELVAQGDTLTLINYGFGLARGTMMTPCSRPFVAGISAATGQHFYTSYFSDKKDMVEGSAISKHGAFLMFPDQLVYHDMRQSAPNVQRWNVDAYGHLIDMPNDTIYTFRKYDERLTPLHYDVDRCIVVTDKGKMLVVNKQLNIVDDYQSDNTYRRLCAVGDVALVGPWQATDDNPGDFWIVRTDGTPLAHITVPVVSAYLHGTDLYLLSDQDLWKINLSTLNIDEKANADGGPVHLVAGS